MDYTTVVMSVHWKADGMVAYLAGKWVFWLDQNSGNCLALKWAPRMAATKVVPLDDKMAQWLGKKMVAHLVSSLDKKWAAWRAFQLAVWLALSSAVTKASLKVARWDDLKALY